MVEQILEEPLVVLLLPQAMIMMHLLMNTVCAQHSNIYLYLHILSENQAFFFFIPCIVLYYYFRYAGLLRQPKWGHLKDLHRAIKLCEPALVSADPTVTRLGNYQEVYLKLSYRKFLNYYLDFCVIGRNIYLSWLMYRLMSLNQNLELVLHSLQTTIHDLMQQCHLGTSITTYLLGL